MKTPGANRHALFWAEGFLMISQRKLLQGSTGGINVTHGQVFILLGTCLCNSDSFCRG